MKSAYVIGLVVVLILIGGTVWYVNSGTPAPTYQAPGAVNDAPAQQQAPAQVTATTSATVQTSVTAPAPQSFAVNGNDETADVKTITVPAGTPVTITFGADAGTTYHGGLDFRSSVTNTGTIAPGSKKTVTFTATKSFSFTPYWPSTNIAKPYTIDIVVQ